MPDLQEACIVYLIQRATGCDIALSIPFYVLLFNQKIAIALNPCTIKCMSQTMWLASLRYLFKFQPVIFHMPWGPRNGLFLVFHVFSPRSNP